MDTNEALHTIPEILALFVPIVAIVMGIGLAMLSLYFDHRKKQALYELLHKERMAAIDKGIDLPPLPPGLLQGQQRRAPTAGDYLGRGVVWLLVGLAIIAAMLLQGARGALWGLVPVAVGISNLILFAYQSRQPPSAN